MMQGFGAQTLHSALSLMPLVDLLLALVTMTQGPGAHRSQSVDLSVFGVFYKVIKDLLRYKVCKP